MLMTWSSPTKEGLQQHLSELEEYCQTWALTVNQPKTKVLIFPKRSRPQRHNTSFTIGNDPVEHTNHYTYLGLTNLNTGHFGCERTKRQSKKGLFC